MIIKEGLRAEVGMHSNNCYFLAPHRTAGIKMKPEYLKREIIVYISEHKGITKTVKGRITEIDENQFVVVDSHGQESTWNEDNIKGFKILGES